MAKADRREKFEAALQAVLDRGEHPSGVRIRKELGKLRFPTDGGLGSEETQWRAEYLTARGWTRESHLRARWKPPHPKAL